MDFYGVFFIAFNKLDTYNYPVNNTYILCTNISCILKAMSMKAIGVEENLNYIFSIFRIKLIMYSYGVISHCVGSIQTLIETVTVCCQLYQIDVATITDRCCHYKRVCYVATFK